MDIRIAREILSTIRSERDVRLRSLRDAEPEVADVEWAFDHEPFVNELCLMLLVGVRHEVERELVRAAARATGDGKELTRELYCKHVREERKKLRGGDGWTELTHKLGLQNLSEWSSSMETLRLVANSYKHDPWATPDKKLLTHLRLDLNVQYATLPESSALRSGLASSVGLTGDSDYCDLTEELLNRAESFVNAVMKAPGLSRVRWGPASINPKDLLH